MANRLIGEVLKETCSLSDEMLEEALKIQKEKGGRIGEILIQKGAISETDLLNALGILFGMPLQGTIPAESM
ncbi:MAG TPA: hypothetical protein VMW42_00790, partial [Desulfatiglandales bacterium]|nr:hypothetical protein [Desulfatiglandales bacterium]